MSQRCQQRNYRQTCSISSSAGLGTVSPQTRPLRLSLQTLPTEVASMPRLLASAIRVANPTPETSGKQALTTLRLPLELGIRGVCAGFQASRQRGRVPMAIDPEELVTLKNHGTMKLRSTVARTMTLLAKERKRAAIVRNGEPAVLKFEQIKDLAAQWEFVSSQ